ncbi:uncharacterized protein METZ01_LOCUS225796 [marine metagenome]|uniref:Uncharacterized protein n=1 Tax=marine metagenome TaxID=408172 RepID=A0A382GDJ3_9ZZZZ
MALKSPIKRGTSNTDVNKNFLDSI